MKKLTKSLCLVLALLMTVSFIPMNAQAAVKLNCKTKTIYIGNSFNLKITGTTKKVTWSSSKKSVATVSSKGKVTGKSEGKATITAKVNNKSYKCVVTVKMKTSDKLSMIHNWLVGDIWNDGFCDLNWYYSERTNSVGETMNVDYTITKLKKSYANMEKYTTFIESLNGAKYDDLKYSWGFLKNEGDSLYQKTLAIDWNNLPEIEDDDYYYDDDYDDYYYDDDYLEDDDYYLSGHESSLTNKTSEIEYDVSLFSQYMDDVVKELYKLE